MQTLVAVFLHYLIISSTVAHRHPLDPLTATEIADVAAVVKTSGHGSKNLTFHYVGLDEPDKEKVLSWLSDPSTGTPPPRRAFAVVRWERQTHEVVIDLGRRSIVSDGIYHGPGYPMYTSEEVTAVDAILQTYEPFIESVRKRGLVMSQMVCGSVSAGGFGEAGARKRVSRVLCFSRGDTENLFAMPIEGITIVMDMDEMRIVEYSDRKMIPVPKSDGSDYRASSQVPPFGPSTKPTTVVQPEGPSFEIDGHNIRYLQLYSILFCSHAQFMLIYWCLSFVLL